VAGVLDITEEFSGRPWQQNVVCFRDGGLLMLKAENDFDSTGQATLDEFSDAVCACVPIEDTDIGFSIVSVSGTPGN